MKKTAVTLIRASKLSAEQKKAVVDSLDQKLGAVEIIEQVDPSPVFK